MTLRTGTSKNGKVHRYYTCSTCARVGKSAGKGRSIRMDKLDDLVVQHLSDRLFTTGRLASLLNSLGERRAQKAAEVEGRILRLQADKTEAEDKLRRLYRMIEEGVAELDDILRDRITELKNQREKAEAALDRIQTHTGNPPVVPIELVERFGRMMRENIANGEIPFRKAYIRSVVDRIEVDDEVIRIVGDKATLEQVIAGKSSTSGVRSFERKWRARKDSNL